MPTALDLISRAMRLTGALGVGETLSADEQTVGLAAANAMLDEWSTIGLLVPRRTRTQLTWPSGEASRTIGATGNFVYDRPTRLDHAFTRQNGVDLPVALWEEFEYSSESSKAATGTLIQAVWMDPTYPNATLYVWPVPVVSVELHLAYLSDLQTFDAADETLALPDGYETAIAYNLALELAPEFQVDVPATVVRRASTSKRSLKRANSRVPQMRSDPVLAGRGYRYNVVKGY